MIESLYELDKSISLFINGLNTPFFDHFFIEATHRFTWIPLYLALIWLLFKAYGVAFWRMLLIIALIITVSDQLSSFVFKPWFERLRPCDDPSINASVHLVNGYKAGGYSFFSSHASNCAALCTFVFLTTKDRVVGFTLLAWTLVNVYSRIYLGVHYISDVLFGLLVGVLLGLGGGLFRNRIFSTQIKYHKSRSSIWIVSVVFMLTIACLLITKLIS